MTVRSTIGAYWLPDADFKFFFILLVFNIYPRMVRGGRLASRQSPPLLQSCVSTKENEETSKRGYGKAFQLPTM